MDNAHFDQYISLYKSTAKQYLSDMKDGTNRLKANGHDAASLEKLYIGAHNIKSQSLVMGLEDIGNLSHEIEKVIKQRIDNGQEMSKEQLEKLEAIIDGIENAVSESESNKNSDLTKEFDALKSLT